MDLRTPSIQPKQSAPSTDSGQVMLGRPESRLENPTQNSSVWAWCFLSKGRQSESVGKNCGLGSFEGFGDVFGIRRDYFAIAFLHQPQSINVDDYLGAGDFLLHGVCEHGTKSAIQLFATR